jgi:HSP20 family molecular chaperone IbpA
MAKDKKSFFERLTGTVRIDDERNMPASGSKNSGGRELKVHHAPLSKGDEPWVEEDEREGELTVDVYQTPDMIVIKTMVAGVHPEDLDINITRDMVTIKGRREEERVAKEDDYFVRELYWGSFSRTVTLPEEIDVDESEAIEKHGLLIIKLPKLDKKRQSKLKVRTI